MACPSEWSSVIHESFSCCSSCIQFHRKILGIRLLPLPRLVNWDAAVARLKDMQHGLFIENVLGAQHEDLHGHLQKLNLKPYAEAPFAIISEQSRTCPWPLCFVGCRRRVTLSRGVMQVEAGLLLKSKAPCMTDISSAERLPPRPSAWLCILTKALNWGLLKTACTISFPYL